MSPARNDESRANKLLHCRPWDTSPAANFLLDIMLLGPDGCGKSQFAEVLKQLLTKNCDWRANLRLSADLLLNTDNLTASSGADIAVCIIKMSSRASFKTAQKNVKMLSSRFLEGRILLIITRAEVPESFAVELEDVLKWAKHVHVPWIFARVEDPSSVVAACRRVQRMVEDASRIRSRLSPLLLTSLAD